MGGVESGSVPPFLIVSARSRASTASTGGSSLSSVTSPGSHSCARSKLIPAARIASSSTNTTSLTTPVAAPAASMSCESVGRAAMPGAGPTTL